ncbi:MAG: tetratricopeptide repeat protein [Aggregatilineales bacterium]
MSDFHGETLVRAHELIEAGNPEEALTLLRPVLDAEPDNADAWWIYAHAVSDPEEARRALGNVLSLDPGYPEAAELLALLNEQYPIVETPSELVEDTADIVPLEGAQIGEPEFLPPPPEHYEPIVDAEPTYDDFEPSQELETTAAPLHGARPVEGSNSARRLPVAAILLGLLAIVIVVAVLLASGTIDQGVAATATPEAVVIVPTLDGEAETNALAEAESDAIALESEELASIQEQDELEAESVEETPSAVTPAADGLLETVAVAPSETTPEPTIIVTSALVTPLPDTSPISPDQGTRPPLAESIEGPEGQVQPQLGIDATSDTATDTATVEPTETPLLAIEESGAGAQTAPDMPIDSEAETLPEIAVTEEIIPTTAPIQDEAPEIAAQETLALEQAATREPESPSDDLEISEEPLVAEEIGVLVPSTDQEALLGTFSAFALTEDPFVLVETSLGATLLVRVCSTEGPELRSNLEPIMDTLAAGVDQLEASVTGVGVQFINCAVERTLRIIAVSRETAAAYSAGAVSRDAFAGAWRAQ